MRRLFYLDVVRGLAILFMVVDHSYDWWLDAAGHSTSWRIYTEFIGTLAAPLFLFLVGAGLALSAYRDMREGKQRRETVRYLLLRGLIIFLWGYLLNLLVFYTGKNPQDVFAVDVLQIIGLSIWLAIPFLWFPTPLVVAAFFLVAILGQTANVWALPAWLDPVVNGQNGISYFPLALWLPFVYLGLAFGQIVPSRKHQGWNMLALVGIGLVSFLVIPFVDQAWGYRHPKPMFTLFSITVIFWLVAMIWYWTERLARRGFLANTLQVMGRTSLMLYVFHHLVGYRLFYLFGWVHGRSWRGEYGVFTPLQTTGLFLGLFLLMTFVSRWWNSRHSSIRKLAWMGL